MPLPGECRQVADLPDGLWALCGPGLADITAEGHELICRYEDDRSPARFPLDQLSNVVIIGAVPLAPALLRRLSRHHITLTMVDELARVMTVCNSQTDDCGDAAGIGGVARTSMDAERRLAFCRRLVGVKISNYARLAAAMPDAKAEVQAMDQLSARAACGRSAAEIRGLEGAAAARWYALFGRSIPSQLGFSRRVAPHAPDVTNILLNFAQSLLHRHATLALRAAGLPASVGILHEPRSGHVALASDLQEMFRHIADRAVLEELGRGAPAHLRIIDRNGQAMIDPLLLRSMVRRLHAALALGCAVDTRPPRSYLHWIYFTARRWRDWFTGGTDELEMFVHPAPPLQLERQP
jgi:CRISPR-associated protein Cas1